MKLTRSLLIFLLFVSCDSNIEIPFGLKDYSYFVATDNSYETDENGRVLSKETKEYHIVDGESELISHSKRTYFYDDKDSVVKSKYYDLLLGNAIIQVDEFIYGIDHQKLREYTINGEGDTLSQRTFNTENGIKTSVEMIRIEELGADDFINHYIVSIYDSEGKLRETKVGQSKNNLEQYGKMAYDTLGRMSKQIWYEGNFEGDILTSQTTINYVNSSNKIESAVTVNTKGDTTAFKLYYYYLDNSTPTEIMDYFEGNLFRKTSYGPNNELNRETIFWSPVDSSTTLYFYENDLLTGKISGQTQ